MPPSTNKFWPVIWRACTLAKKAAAAPKSDGSPKVLLGFADIISLIIKAKHDFAGVQPKMTFNKLGQDIDLLISSNIENLVLWARILCSRLQEIIRRQDD